MFRKYFEPGALLSFVGYRNLLISTTVTVIAFSAFPIVLAVEILDVGGNATELGLILAVRVLSGVVLSPIGGVWVDRYSRKNLLIFADAFRAIMSISVIVFSVTSFPLWALGLIVFLMGASDAVGTPAAQSIIPSLLPDHLLPAGNVSRNLAIKGSSIAGPGIAGALVIALGTRATFILITALFIVGAALLLRIKEPARTYVPNETSHFVTEIREGLAIVWKHKWIAAMIAMATVQLMIVMGTENVMLPVITKREFGTPSVFAIAATLFSLGGAISAIISIKAKPKYPGLVCVSVWGLFALAPLVLAFPATKLEIYVLYFIAGTSVGPWEAFWSTQVQREIPPHLQGRVFAIDYMGSVGLMPLGMALAGPLTNFFGERQFLIGAAALHLFICAITLLVPGTKEMKSPSNSSQGEQIKG
jgi:MFS family permease